MTQENGALAKLVNLRQNFLTAVQEARVEFVNRIKTLREEYLNQVVDAALGDPKLSELERALGSLMPQPQPPVAPRPAVTADMIPIGQSGNPEKFPMKRFRGVYGSCPNCNSPLWEPQAKFCSQCAYPLDEL